MAEVQTSGNPEQSGPTTDDFFNALENEVNSGVLDEPITEVTQPQTEGAPAVTPSLPVEGSEQSVNWEKRYKDSTREAQNMNSELTDLRPFVPILDAMKHDSGLVEHVRDYLQSGGTPAKSVQDRLKLNEDFVYDAHDAVTDPESDSAKVMQEHINTVVNKRARDILQNERQRSTKVQQDLDKKKVEIEFKKRHGMDDEGFKSMVEKAKGHTMTLDDIHFLLNRDQTNKNVANATKKDMLSQMQNVRNVPTSASGASSTQVDVHPENAMFDSILGIDNEVDTLFDE
jgi:hypothetical protein